jgi:hypothetical protein
MTAAALWISTKPAVLQLKGVGGTEIIGKVTSEKALAKQPLPKNTDIATSIPTFNFKSQKARKNMVITKKTTSVRTVEAEDFSKQMPNSSGKKTVINNGTIIIKTKGSASGSSSSWSTSSGSSSGSSGASSSGSSSRSGSAGASSSSRRSGKRLRWVDEVVSPIVSQPK